MDTAITFNHFWSDQVTVRYIIKGVEAFFDFQIIPCDNVFSFSTISKKVELDEGINHVVPR